jgi:hypothetical protein
MMAEESRVPKHSFHLLRNMVDRYRSFFHPSVIESGYKVKDRSTQPANSQTVFSFFIAVTSLVRMKDYKCLSNDAARLSIGLERFSSWMQSGSKPQLPVMRVIIRTSQCTILSSKKGPQIVHHNVN